MFTIPKKKINKRSDDLIPKYVSVSQTPAILYKIEKYLNL